MGGRQGRSDVWRYTRVAASSPHGLGDNSKEPFPDRRRGRTACFERFDGAKRLKWANMVAKVGAAKRRDRQRSLVERRGNGNNEDWAY